VAPSLAALLGSYESRRKRPLDALSILSLREREVFRLAADCLLTREIARELCISRKTVDTHLYRIHRKLGLRTSAELVRLACNLGLVRRGATREIVGSSVEPLGSEGEGEGKGQGQGMEGG
jgi:DNA-binding CsgD family transcriptional regulator